MNSTQHEITKLIHIVADAKRAPMLSKAPHIEKAVDQQININNALLNELAALKRALDKANENYIELAAAYTGLAEYQNATFEGFHHGQ
jgi:cytolysin (calcineurin-like family phosphatase)